MKLRSLLLYMHRLFGLSRSAGWRCFLTPRSVFFHKIQADRRLLGIPSDVILIILIRVDLGWLFFYVWPIDAVQSDQYRYIGQ